MNAFDEIREDGRKQGREERQAEIDALNLQLQYFHNKCVEYEKELELKDEQLKSAKKEIEYLYDAVDGWKGQATGKE